MLNTETNLAAPDDFYEALIEAHRDLSNEQSQELNAALILLLANHLGDMAVLREALAQARASVTPASNPPQTH
ncbi:DUF2783 domain-containing protein [Achromobacter xylosoxidans]|jgi:hypothetical protein|uniref:DUF2783 domain-containing protein n=1 Tax=Alcaligenes xylosoxydans xylosoxydans TaxID=85698 RepID=A0A0D6IM88_ALCXX|nr:DUF2783 domain-containing protein [Achromobacter xylosoxidans]AHC49797.1 hypothetical protein AX27061_5342 [Achromobacter xylosoxidans NBRC 15126 = ATCC 27061]AMH05120.1 DUF2783 domain-containing protein [Achromobacter xylosoxidans]EFV85779.1 hypothetical protein HMPREF0005_01495 [Achromobacter xylosoxidans C54]KAA5922972.1 DUF2783 domain-containing protein [Achromobacter xylosoxidans]KWU17589.1 hypothetical protein AS148_22040 [Achromobacter xylosoxidans]